MFHFDNTKIYSFSLGALLSSLNLSINTPNVIFLVLIFICKAVLGGLIASLTTDFYKKICDWIKKRINNG